MALCRLVLAAKTKVSTQDHDTVLFLFVPLAVGEITPSDRIESTLCTQDNCDKSVYVCSMMV